MNNKIDKRIIKTKEKIRSTCFILLKKYDWQQLSIAYIAKEAGVNRSTFYANFEDKQTLLEQTLSYVYLNTLEKSGVVLPKRMLPFTRN
ncbi:TetR/AcrR family transcriptional regulator [Vagococcus xieshaowenii]|uniref:TetR/AcrR family transcriptional regulator n=1 Tax=Vagococcus xieshaowenii TaxID=2562451 RepID=A0AAJ5EF86_9ENTE|nr:TetR/AcrR family transcriptional regulator [Vagococcus xieshaowenii]QCA28683.1 TetR/AcrR family transcriptional regulator [Vagococcus xieshaowenii]TFZ40509.1 TetR/AcrR family transcriptional regulator [Vagococcus xieshaowenii]